MFTPRESITVALALAEAACQSMDKCHWTTAAEFWRLNAIAARAAGGMSVLSAKNADTASADCLRRAASNRHFA
jgi:hypothetical protein